MASIAAKFVKGKGKKKDKKNAQGSTSSQSEESCQQTGNGKDKSKGSLKKNGRSSKTWDLERKGEPVGASSSNAACPDNQREAPPKKDQRPGSLGLPLTSDPSSRKICVVSPSRSLPEHQVHPASCRSAVENREDQVMVNEVPAATQEHAGSRGTETSVVNPEYPSLPAVGSLVHNSQASRGVTNNALENEGEQRGGTSTICPNPSSVASSGAVDGVSRDELEHPGYPGSGPVIPERQLEVASVPVHGSQEPGSATDNLLQNTGEQREAFPSNPVSIAASPGVTDHVSPDSFGHQSSDAAVPVNPNGEASGEASDSVSHDNQPSNPVSHGLAVTTSTASHNNQERLASIDAVPPNDGEIEGNAEQSLTHQPVQVSSNETDVVIANGAEGLATQQEATAIFDDQRLVVQAVMGDRGLKDKLSRPLDRTHRVIKCWEHLACTTIFDAPLETRLRCKLNSEHSPTEKLIDLLATENGDTELKDFVAALKGIQRNDVVNLVKEYYPDAEASTDNISDSVASDTDLIERMATKLNQKSRVNKYWVHLGRHFKVSNDKLKEIEYRNNPTFALMEYIYAKKKSFTLASFNGIMESLKRQDVVKKLERLMQEDEGGSKEMKEAVPLDSDLMKSICVCLNNPSNVLKNWRNLAGALEVSREIYEDFNPQELKSPTVVLFDWIFAANPELTVGELCSALRDIERNDLVNTVEEHLRASSD